MTGVGRTRIELEQERLRACRLEWGYYLLQKAYRLPLLASIGDLASLRHLNSCMLWDGEIGMQRQGSRIPPFIATIFFGASTLEQVFEHVEGLFESCSRSIQPFFYTME
jgi:hypothetical protein